MVMPCDLPELAIPIGISFLELEYAEEPGCFCDVADLLEFLPKDHPVGIALVCGHQQGPKPDHFEDAIQRREDLKKIFVALGYKVFTEDEYANSQAS